MSPRFRLATGGWQISANGGAQSANIVFAADTFLVRGGKIAVQTFAAKIEPTTEDSPTILVT